MKLGLLTLLSLLMMVFVGCGNDGSDGLNGSDGLDGIASLISVTSEPEGLSCTNGGQKLEVGIDINFNGVLDQSEVDKTDYVCNGLSSSEELQEANYSINGSVQKGPFISGSAITIQELDKNLEPTGKSYQTTTSDDFGNFSIGKNIHSKFVEIIATGFYFDEVSGHLSDANLTLRALADLSVNEKVNVNLLTTLEKDRTKHLYVDEGLSFEEATTQSEAEILKIFLIEGINVPTFSSMDISSIEDFNGILLAVSSILQNNNTVAELSEILSKINLDLKIDGVLDQINQINSIILGSSSLNIGDVRNNLFNRYFSLGLDIEVPPFENFVDSDGDRILNMHEDDFPDSFYFVDVPEAEYAHTYISNTIEIQGISPSGFSLAKIDNGTLIKNGTPLLGMETSVVNGDKIEVALEASKFGDTVSTNLVVGDATDTYSVKTRTPTLKYVNPYIGGDSPVDTAAFFAVPFLTNVDFNGKYIFVGVQNYNLNEVSLYDDNSGAPGVELVSYAYQTGFNVNTPYLADDNNTQHSVPSFGPIQVYLGSSGFDFHANGKYWVVLKYSTPTLALVAPAESVSFSEMKLSNDGITWQSWSTGRYVYSSPERAVALGITN